MLLAKRKESRWEKIYLRTFDALEDRGYLAIRRRDMMPVDLTRGAEKLLGISLAELKADIVRLNGCFQEQGKDGFWHQLLDRPESYEESSCTAIYTYCMAHAINKGWISALAYGPAVQLAWHAVEASIDRTGRVTGTCVGTGMGFDPAFYMYRPVSTAAAHGYGPVIWAGAEMLLLLENQYPKSNDSAVQFYPEKVNTDEPIFNYDGEIRF